MLVFEGILPTQKFMDFRHVSFLQDVMIIKLLFQELARLKKLFNGELCIMPQNEFHQKRVESKGTPTYPWSIPQASPNPQMKGIPS